MCFVTAAVLTVNGGCSTMHARPADLTIIDATVYPGPGEALLKRANIEISDGRIEAIYFGEPRRTNEVIDAAGRMVTVGLWNSHVHLNDPRLAASSEPLLRHMFLRYGFTTVIDTGSMLDDTLALARRIERREVAGPRIITANGSFVYLDGTPSYLPGITLPEITRPEQAGPMVAAVLGSGADGIKIFSGSYQAMRDTVHLPPDIIEAICDAAHTRGSFVFSHPTDRIGLINAVENGIDVLAHTAPQAGSFGDALVVSMRENGVALVPTLTLWRIELLRAGLSKESALAVQSIGVEQLGEFARAGGEILFGTDVGFINEFDPTEELELMGRAGMSIDDVLASMTTAPARRFKGESGRLEVGVPADLVIYEASHFSDFRSLARVAYTIRDGRVVFEN
ncbi:MAG: amidohydrolase family protein [Pseudomonadota bacterium]